MDNIFIERLWRSLKYECVYLHELEDGRHTRELIGAWFDFYNHVRPHSALAGRACPSAALVGANFISRGYSLTGAHLISALDLSKE